MARQELLMKPSIGELSQKHRKWIDDAFGLWNMDSWYQKQNANFHPDVQAVFVGFYLDRSGEKAVPVYKTDNGVFAVVHNVHDRSVTWWDVEGKNVYALDATLPLKE